MTHPKLDKLHEWLLAASTLEQQALADAATSGSISTLFQYAYGHRGISVDKAGLVETHAATLRKANPALPLLLRTDLVAACRACPYAQRCLGQAATPGDFEKTGGE